MPKEVVIPQWVDASGVANSVSDTTNATTHTGPLPVTSTSITPGTGATSLGKAEDAAHGDGDTGVAVWSRRIDAAATSAGTSGDYAAINTDATGLLWARIANLLGITALGSAVSASSFPVVGASDWREKITAVGGATVPTDAAVTVANTSTSVCVANANRSSVLIRNTGSQTVYLFTGGAATTSKFPLNAGETVVYRNQLAITGIVSSGTCAVYVVEEQW